MSDDDKHIAEAARLLRNGGLVALPTETVYGLGADAGSASAVARIFAAKGRPSFNPLIAHVATLEEARSEGIFTPSAMRLAERFWPGPLTLVLPRSGSGSVCDLACAGLSSVGLRVPNHPIALALLRLVGRPVAAPSANRSGRLSPTAARHVREELGDAVDMIVDGGPCPIGVESSIVSCDDGSVVLLRPGAITAAAIEAVVGQRLEAAADAIRAPGMLTSHYTPDATLRLDAVTLRAGESGLDFHRTFGGGALDLSASGDLVEAAANLYRHLRCLDAAGTAVIAVASVPCSGIGAAINDRLRRAAVPRH